MVIASLPKQRQTTHDKKRHGMHHKSSKNYVKTYWPYLPMLMIVVVGFVLNMTWHPGQAVLGYATSMSGSALLSDTNIQRSQNGRSVLTLNSQLAKAAQAKANDMAARNYWSHVTPDGIQPWQFIANAGYTYTAAGENLAYGFDSSDAAVSGWMNSPSHRENLLSTNFQEVGFGIANASSYQNEGEQTIVVAMYAKPQPVVTPSTVQNGRAPDAPAKKVTPTTPTPVTAAEPAQQATDTPAAPVATTPTPQATTQKDDTLQPTTVKPTTENLNARPVSRIDVLTDGNAQWAALTLSVLASIAILSFVLRHAKLWRRYLVKGEDFAIKHPVFDTFIVFVGVLGFLLTRTTGFIH